jgi:hypothetical protein
MNKHKFLTVAISGLLLVTACKKSDVQHEDSTATGTNTAWQWKSLSNWSSETGEEATVYSTTIEDPAITADIAANGMVIVFKNSGSGVAAMPYEEAVSGGSYSWYYQIAEGSLTIQAEVSGNVSAPATGQGVHYFILTTDKLKELDTKGHSKEELMKLSFENAQAILK